MTVKQQRTITYPQMYTSPFGRGYTYSRQRTEVAALEQWEISGRTAAAQVIRHITELMYACSTRVLCTTC
jgi:hypothetical protein